MLIRLLEKNDPSPLRSLLHSLKHEEIADPDAMVCCAACLQAVTSNRFRIEIHGASEHIYTNPHGFRFQIVCYREAAGCICEGTPTSMHTWFPGYDWCYALCGNCRLHLGWQYNAPGGGFYGLIKDRLVEKHSAQN